MNWSGKNIHFYSHSHRARYIQTGNSYCIPKCTSQTTRMMHSQMGSLKMFSVQHYWFVILRTKYSTPSFLQPRLHILCVLHRSSLEEFCWEKRQACDVYYCLLFLERYSFHSFPLILQKFYSILTTHILFLFLPPNRILLIDWDTIHLSITPCSQSSTFSARTVILSINHGDKIWPLIHIQSVLYQTILISWRSRRKRNIAKKKQAKLE